MGASKAVWTIDMAIPNTATWQDAFLLGDDDDTSWDLTGQNFVMDIKNSRDDQTYLLELSTNAGSIVVDDITLRVIHLNVDDATIQSTLNIGEYVYDLIMYDGSVPPIRRDIMGGKLRVYQGVTRT